tara:strand:- start:598 stop:978 length:381 start_codon:yes stop_codon:yes gene_type:complete
MTIKYKKKRLNLYLILLVFWTGFLVFNSIYSDFENWTTYLWIGISVMYISMYAYQYVKPYITIKDGQIFSNSPFSKKIKLVDIKEIKKFAGDYILKTEDSELIINTQLIDTHSLSKLDTELSTLKI